MARLASVFAILLLIAPALLVSGHDGPHGRPKPKYNGRVEFAKLMAAGKKARIFNTLGEAIYYSGADKVMIDIMNYYKITLLAPTDAAFAALGPGPLPPKKDTLIVLGLHMLKGRRKYASLLKDKRSKKYTTAVPGVKLPKQSRTNGTSFVAGFKGAKFARIIPALANGYVSRVVALHGINNVILPPPTRKPKGQASVKEDVILAWAEESEE